ncbi:MAG: hypothetical protein KDD61_10770 [Bdellovibrionales bacterium]|nr:hypothetical protein [Bdellovibrionales bacterium]
MKLLISVFLSLLIFIPMSHGREIIGSSIYEMKSQRKKLLFTSQFERRVSEGKEIETVKFFDPSGELAVEEEVRFSNGQVESFVEKSFQTKAEGLIKVVMNRVLFEWSVEGKVKKDDEALKGNFVTGLSLVRFVHKNWEPLKAGKEIDIRFAVPHRLETVGFSLKRQTQKEKKGSLLIKMKPSSFIISALVDPVYFTFDESSKELRSYVGRVKPKKKVNNSWKDLDAEVVYRFREDVDLSAQKEP